MINQSVRTVFLRYGKIQKKLVLTQKQILLTSERCAQHSFAGLNTQHLRHIQYIIQKST